MCPSTPERLLRLSRDKFSRSSILYIRFYCSIVCYLLFSSLYFIISIFYFRISFCFLSLSFYLSTLYTILYKLFYLLFYELLFYSLCVPGWIFFKSEMMTMMLMTIPTLSYSYSLKLTKNTKIVYFFFFLLENTSF